MIASSELRDPGPLAPVRATSAADDRRQRRERGGTRAGLEAIGRSGDPSVIVVGELEIGGGDVGLELSHVLAPGMATTLGCADHPRQRHLRRGGVVGPGYSRRP